MPDRRDIQCQHCSKPMELFMARSEIGEVTITFECRECKRTCDIVAKTRPPTIPADMMN